jgi:hypothetical protein
METDPLTPVYLSERRGTVSVLKLLGTGAKLAIFEGDKWEPIGQVVPIIVTEKYSSGPRKGQSHSHAAFQWYWDERDYGSAQGHELTKTKAIAALLAHAGYVIAPENATIPELF